MFFDSQLQNIAKIRFTNKIGKTHKQKKNKNNLQTHETLKIERI
jgi:hypothetical protein